MQSPAPIPTRRLGKTDLSVSILGIGGYHIGSARDADHGTRIIRTAIDEGVNFLDNAWCYNAGVSERIMGRALRDGYRGRVVLMTKNHGRDATTFRSQLEDSLSRLQTERIDVLQFHEIVNDGDPEKIYSDGALDEARRAREEGKIGFIGFTGHRWPYLLRQMLDGDFEWDTVQLPANLLDHHYRSFTGDILPILVERDIGIIGMKSLAGNGKSMLKTGVGAAEAITYSLSLPIHTLVSGMDSLEVLEENIATARAYAGLTDAQRDQLLKRVAPFARDGALESYKSG